MTKTLSKTQQALRNRTRLEWVLFAALLLIAWLFPASRYNWWPLNDPQPDLGSAFLTAENIPKLDDAAAAVPANAAGGTGGPGGGTTTGRSTTTNTTTTNSSTTNSGGGSSNNGGGNNGGGTGSDALLALAAGIDVGDSKQAISAQLNGLSQNCVLTVNLPLGLGKQEVCTINQDGRTITVTYLDDNVISASLGGF